MFDLQAEIWVALADVDEAYISRTLALILLGAALLALPVPHVPSFKRVAIEGADRCYFGGRGTPKRHRRLSVIPRARAFIGFVPVTFCARSRSMRAHALAHGARVRPLRLRVLALGCFRTGQGHRQCG